jgi:hypothetical protein
LKPEQMKDKEEMELKGKIYAKWPKIKTKIVHKK